MPLKRSRTWAAAAASVFSPAMRAPGADPVSGAIAGIRFDDSGSDVQSRYGCAFYVPRPSALRSLSSRLQRSVFAPPQTQGFALGCYRSRFQRSEHWVGREFAQRPNTSLPPIRPLSAHILFYRLEAYLAA